MKPMRTFSLTTICILLSVIVIARADTDSFLTTGLPSTIVYLIAETAVDDPVAQQADVLQRLGAVALHSQEAFEQYRALFLVEAVILHPSALDFIQTETIAAAYSQGTVISVLNIPQETFTELANRPLSVDRYILIENDVVYFTAYSFDGGWFRSGGSQVGRFSDEIENEAFTIGIWSRINQAREDKLRFLQLHNP